MKGGISMELNEKIIARLIEPADIAFLNQKQPFDLAVLYGELDEESQAYLLSLLTYESRADLLSFLNPEDAAEFLEEMEIEEQQNILSY